MKIPLYYTDNIGENQGSFINAKCRMQNAKLSGHFVPKYKLQVESGKLQVEGLKPIVDKAVVTRSLTSLRKERARNTTAAGGGYRECELA